MVPCCWLVRWQACDPGTGRVTAESLLARLRVSGRPFDEAKVAAMVQEMDYEAFGLSMSTLESAFLVSILSAWGNGMGRHCSAKQGKAPLTVLPMPHVVRSVP